MSTNLILLAVLMFAATYPSRALGLLTPGLDRLPKIAFDYLQLVGPAVLAALAAVSVMVVVGADDVPRSTSGSNGWRSSPASRSWRGDETCSWVSSRRSRSWPSREARVWRVSPSDAGVPSRAYPRRASASISMRRLRIHQGADLDHRRRRPDLAEDRAVDGRDLA